MAAFALVLSLVLRFCVPRSSSSSTSDGNINCSSLWKSVQPLLEKLTFVPPYDPVVPLLGIYQNDSKSLHRANTHQCQLQHCSLQLSCATSLGVQKQRNGQGKMWCMCCTAMEIFFCFVIFKKMCIHMYVRMQASMYTRMEARRGYWESSVSL